MLGGLGLAAATAGVATQVPQAIGADRVLNSGTICPAPGDCVVEVEGFAVRSSGGRRGINHTWDVFVEENPEPVGGIDVGPRTSGRMTQGPVVGVSYRGDLVAIRFPDGKVVRGLEVGARGVVQLLAFALMAGALSWGLIGHAFAKRRAGIGWWAGDRALDSDFLFPAALGSLAVTVFGGMSFGLTWQLSLGLVVFFAGLILVGLIRQRRESRN
jgi:hypothetical protein